MDAFVIRTPSSAAKAAEKPKHKEEQKRGAEEFEDPFEDIPLVKKPKAKPKGKIEGKTFEQHRRALGDKVKQQISFEKWAIAAETHVETAMSPAVFRMLVVPSADSIVPAEWTVQTPVVVAHLRGSTQIAEICGASKIKAGSRVETYTADRMDIIFFPGESKARLWWTMS